MTALTDYSVHYHTVLRQRPGDSPAAAWGLSLAMVCTSGHRTVHEDPHWQFSARVQPVRCSVKHNRGLSQRIAPIASRRQGGSVWHQVPLPQAEAEGGAGDSQVSVLGLAPGTPFMARVEEALCYWVCQRLMMQPYRNVKFEVSGANVPVRRGS